MSNDRKKLIDAALAEFIEKGITNSDLASIASRAGTEPAVARALFTDKDNLLKILLEEMTEPIVGAIAMAVEKTDDPRVLIEESLRLMDRWLLDNPEYVQLIRRCMAEGPEAMRGIYRRSLYPSDFFERLDEFVRSGKIHSGDLFMIVVILDSLMFFPHMMMPIINDMLGDETEIDFHRRRREAIMKMFDQGLFAE